MRRLRDVKVGDEVLVIDGREATTWTVEAVDETTVTAGAVRYDRETGDARHRRDGVRRRLRTSDEWARDLLLWEVGRYLAAFHMLVEDNADLDERLDGASLKELTEACHAGKQLCDVLGVRP